MSADKYTAETVTWVKTWVPGKLFSFRTTRDQGFRFVPGQFARLGVAKPDPSAADGSGSTIVWRAYSIVSAPYDEHLEFFSIVVDGGEFTSELEKLGEGDTIYVDKTAFGFLTTAAFPTGKDLWMLSSGTGLAPFISVLLDLQVWDDYEHLIVVHSVRTAEELAYRETIEGLADHPYFGEMVAANPHKLIYLPSITREIVPGALNGRITTLIETGELERRAGVALDPERGRVMLCGNPEMVSDLRHLLASRGFAASRRGRPGNLAVENYW
ncbi:ferredoxin--NADP reductase [Pigmentiphaga litoralis]|uniref:ferredoxin--NADP(+) reductase n=1 Tax=Pigmentiphaga litoralis TaxID=516702 RepID=A0A7Y9IYT9_9BURK|nr:ferredoxin--NADP reductase [Pigmentiphaga litoralis]NYE26950.1 ferredoxin--NADP+ reductase [Pigmentiphaga litoralis]NYE85640.1 ferredoxin--NADP+ reductase [Pigmentiphaga litoralis]